MSKTRIVKKVIRVDARNSTKRLNIKLPRHYKGIHQIKVLAVPTDTNLSSNAVYFGTGAGTKQGAILDNDFIGQLERREVTTKSLFFELGSASNQKYYLAYPTRFGFPSFLLQTPNGSFQGGFLAPQLVSITDQETGKVEDYYVYESIDSNLQGRLYINS